MDGCCSKGRVSLAATRTNPNRIATIQGECLGRQSFHLADHEGDCPLCLAARHLGVDELGGVQKHHQYRQPFRLFSQLHYRASASADPAVFALHKQRGDGYFANSADSHSPVHPDPT